MARVVLIDWNAAAAAVGLAALRRAGHDPRLIVPSGSESFKKLLASPPEVILIDLARRPAEGRNIGVWLRQRKATRLVPLVFVGGVSEKVEHARALLPDATYTAWSHISPAVRRAMRAAPKAPVVRGSMDAYAATPLSKKLGIKPESTVLLLGAPANFEATLGTLPAGVRIQRRSRVEARLVLLFARSQADLRRRFAAAARALAVDGSLWILWRKKSSGEPSDLSGNDVRAHGLARGFVDYKIASIDHTWSGLRFARRRGG